jgi:hypothetical protein
MSQAFYKTAFRASPGMITPFNELDPVYELPQIEQAAIEITKKSLLDRKIVGHASEIITRRLIIGDQSGTHADLVCDLDIVSTAQLAALVRQTQDSSNITAGDLSHMLVSGETIPSQKAVAIYGFIDLTPEPDRDLVALQFKRGNSDVVGFFPTQHCYVGDLPNGGVFGEPRPVFSGQMISDVKFTPYIMLWEEEEKITMRGIWGTSTDKMVIILGFISEKIGENISPTGPRGA